MPINVLKNIGETIRNRRTALGVTQERLAQISGIGLRTIREIEKGNPRSLSILIKVADVLGLTLQLNIKSVN